MVTIGNLPFLEGTCTFIGTDAYGQIFPASRENTRTLAAVGRHEVVPSYVSIVLVGCCSAWTF